MHERWAWEQRQGLVLCKNCLVFGENILTLKAPVSRSISNKQVLQERAWGEKDFLSLSLTPSVRVRARALPLLYFKRHSYVLMYLNPPTPPTPPILSCCASATEMLWGLSPQTLTRETLTDSVRCNPFIKEYYSVTQAAFFALNHTNLLFLLCFFPFFALSQVLQQWCHRVEDISNSEYAQCHFHLHSSWQV